MATATGKRARRLGGNKHSIKRRNRRGRKHTYSLKMKGVIPWFMHNNKVVEVETN